MYSLFYWSSCTHSSAALAPLTCTYCFHKGRLECNCFCRKYSFAKAFTSLDAPISHDSASRCPNVPPQTNCPPPSSCSSHASSPPFHTKWCFLHEAGNHSSDECFAIHRLKSDLTASRFDTLSGGSFKPTLQRPRLMSEIPRQQQHIHSSIPSVVAASSLLSMLNVTFVLNQLPISLGVDMSASVTLLCESAYFTLKLISPDLSLELQKSTITLFSVQGSTLNVTGTVTLPISLAPNSKFFNIHFYVTPQFALPYDGLLGLHSLIAHDISVHPKMRCYFLRWMLPPCNEF